MPTSPGLFGATNCWPSGTATVAEVGYGNPANFSISFSRHFGYAPSETRRRVAVK